MVPIPDGLQKGIRKAKVKNVHDRFLAQKVINAKNGFFRKDRTGKSVKFARRSQIAPEWFFYNDARAARQPRCFQAFDDRTEQRGWNSQIADRKSTRLNSSH